MHARHTLNRGYRPLQEAVVGIQGEARKRCAAQCEFKSLMDFSADIDRLLTNSVPHRRALILIFGRYDGILDRIIDIAAEKLRLQDCVEPEGLRIPQRPVSRVFRL